MNAEEFIIYLTKMLQEMNEKLDNKNQYLISDIGLCILGLFIFCGLSVIAVPAKLIEISFFMVVLIIFFIYGAGY